MQLGTALIREIAVLASADPRTVRRVLRGERALGMVDDRIRRVLVERGIFPSMTDTGPRARRKDRGAPVAAAQPTAARDNTTRG
mgnify:CR=1 FL=1